MLRFKRKNFFKTINFKIALVFALLLLITLEIVGAIFVKQLESKNIQDFKQSVQIPTYIDNSLSEQLTVSSTRKANGQIKTILSNYNNTNVDEIQVVDSKGTIRGTSDVNDQSVVGQKRPIETSRMRSIIIELTLKVPMTLRIMDATTFQSCRYIVPIQRVIAVS